MTLTERLKKLIDRVDVLEDLYLELEEGDDEEYQLGLTLQLLENSIEDIENKLDEAEIEFKIGE